MKKNIRITETELVYLIKNRILSESKNTAIQLIIDTSFNQMKVSCEDDYYTQSFAQKICDLIDSIQNIEVVNSTIGNTMDYKQNKSDFLKIDVDIHIDSIFPFLSFDDFLYELGLVAKKIIGLPVIIDGKVTNIRKNFDW